MSIWPVVWLIADALGGVSWFAVGPTVAVPFGELVPAVVGL